MLSVVRAPQAGPVLDDPERHRQAGDRFRATTIRELERFGGTIEHAGEAVVSTFGAVAAQEDHAVRALHGALAVHAAWPDARIGVSSGEVVVDEGDGGRRAVSGSAVQVAAALGRSAAVGETLAAERTIALAGPLFLFGSRREVASEGLAWPAAARPLWDAATGERPLGVAGLGKAFVGREPELELLRTTYRRVLERSEPHVVTVFGEAGVGKTSLVGELASWLDEQSSPAVQRRARCLSYGRGDTYGPLAAVLREQLGLGPTATADRVLELLSGREIVALTLGIDVGGDLHPLAAREQLHAAWVHLFEEIAAFGPGVVVIEDLHWADEPLLDLLEVVARDARGPLLLLTTARPELADARRDWMAGCRNSATVWLEPLTPDDAESMVRRLLGSSAPRGLERLVGERAEGNPFFVEELLASLLDAGLLYRRDGVWELDEGRAGAIPDSVRGVIAARFDLLALADQSALEAAAVVGRTFTEASVCELVPDEQPDFALLENRGFVRRLPAQQGERRYAFKHALTRDVVYVGVPKPLRGRLHATVAERLEQAAESPDEVAALLAHHYAEAVSPEDVDLVWTDEPARAAELRGRAVRWLSRAGELAIRRFAVDDGLALLHRALSLEPPPPSKARSGARSDAPTPCATKATRRSPRTSVPPSSCPTATSAARSTPSSL